MVLGMVEVFSPDFSILIEAVLLFFLILIFYELVKLRSIRKEFSDQLSDIKVVLDKYAGRDIVLWAAEQLKKGTSVTGVRHLLYEGGYADADEIVQKASILNRAKK